MTTRSVGSWRGPWDRERSLWKIQGHPNTLSNIPNPTVTAFLALFWQVYCCERCYHWGKLGKGYMGTVHVICHFF